MPPASSFNDGILAYSSPAFANASCISADQLSVRRSGYDHSATALERRHCEAFIETSEEPH